MQRRPARLVIVHARGDAARACELDAHLRAARQAGLVTTWHEQKVEAGQEPAEEAKRELDAADLVVLLLSVNFLNCDQCDEHARRALARRERGECAVVPVLVAPVDWALAPFSHLTPLPHGGTAIELWPSPAEAWAGVAFELRALALRAQGAAAPAPKALVLRGAGAPIEYHFVFGLAALLGRSTACDFAFPLAPAAMSKRHARLTSAGAGGAFVFEDLGSRHGTARNGRPLAGSAPLDDGDELRLGGLPLQFRRHSGRTGRLVYRAAERRGAYVLSADDEVEIPAESASGEGGVRVRRAPAGFAVAPASPVAAAWVEARPGTQVRLGGLVVDVEVRP